MSPRPHPTLSPAVLALALAAVPSLVREGRNEPIALSRDRGDEAGLPIVVLQLDPQAADVAIHDIALGHEVRAPHAVQDLLPADDPAAATGQQVQEALLDRAQMHDRAPR